MDTGSVSGHGRRQCRTRGSQRTWLLLLLGLLPTPALALTCTSTATGNWTNPAIWTGCGGGVPGAGDTAIIDGNGVTVTLTGNVSVAALVMDPPPGNNRTNALDVGANTITVAADLDITGGANNRPVTLMVSTGTVNVGGSIHITPADNNANIAFSGAGTLNVAGDFDSGANLTPATGTVNYNGAGAQSMGVYTYHHLVLSGGGGSKTPGTGTTIIQGNFTVGAGVTYAGNTNNPVVSLAGNFANGGTFSSGSGLFTFNGTVPQQLTGATTFTNLALNNAGGLTLNSTVTVQGTLTLDNGRITTGSQRVIIGQTGSIANVAASRYVAGTVEKQYPALPADPALFNFPVGDPTDYTPVQVDFTSLASSGSLAVSTPTVPADHPQIGSATLDQDLSVNRYWTLTSLGGLAGTYTATFNYVTGDKDGAANPPDFVSQRYDNGSLPGGTWFDTVRSGGVGNSIELSGLAAFGDFAVAERGGQGSNHFVISHAGTGVNCAAVTVTITAHKSNHNVEDTLSGLATITSRNAGGTLRGDWSLVTGNGVFTPGAVNSGTATYNFVDADDGVVVLALLYTYPETVNINVDNVFGASEHSGNANNGSEPVFTDPPLTMLDSGFILTSGATIGDQIAGKDSDLAPGAQALSIQAVRTDDNTGACVSVFADGAELDIELASECVNPSACSAAGASADPRLRITTPADSQLIDHYAAGAVPPIPASLTPVTFRFGVNSAAPFVLNYPDAGIIRLHFRRNIPLGDGSGSGNFMAGNSNSFLVRPFAFSIEGPANFTAADATGTAFVRAGESFMPNVEAVVWEAGDDTDNNGVPDTAADLTGNAVTPNFGNESVPPTVDIVHQLVLPDPPGDAGVLSGGSGIGGFNNGVATPTLSFDEVGIVDLTADLDDYLGNPAADITGGRRNVGRFFPDRFAVTDNGPAFTEACIDGVNPLFTYQDQAFYYGTAPLLTITALNAAGDVTENYGGGTAGPEGFWKLDTALDRDYTDQAGMSADFGFVADADVTLDEHTDFDGDGRLALDSGDDGDAFMYARMDEEDEFAADVDLEFQEAALTDSDGACYDQDDNGSCDVYTIAALGGATLRFGRLNIANASGSELLPLALPVQAEYWNGGGFVTNGEDVCSAITPTDLALSSAVEGAQADGDVDVSNAGTCTGSGVAAATVANQPFAAGDAGLSFSAPGAGCTGYADVTVDLGAGTGVDLEWLRYDWDGDGTHDNDPAGRATFGIFHGNDSLIYIREPWN